MNIWLYAGDVSNVSSKSSPVRTVQAGISTRRSREIEVTSTRERSADTWNNIVVSARIPSTLLSIPSRESEPRTTNVERTALILINWRCGFVPAQKVVHISLADIALK